MAQHPNPIALRAIRAILSAAHDLTFALGDQRVEVSVEKADVGWTRVLDGLDETMDGPWPPEVKIKARWEGGSAEQELRAFWWLEKTSYWHLVGVKALSPHDNTPITFVTFGISVREALPEGEAEVFAEISFQRHKKLGETEEEWTRRRARLRWAASAAGLDMPTPATARLCTVQVPSGALVEPAEKVFERLVKVVLVKLPIMARHNPDAVKGAPLYDIDAEVEGNGEEEVATEEQNEVEEPGGAAEDKKEKRNAILPLPGGAREYMNTLKHLLEFVRDGFPDASSLNSFLMERYGANSDKSRASYLHLIRSFGLMDDYDGQFRLTRTGREWLNNPSGVILFEIIDAEVLGMFPLLQLTGEIGLLSPELAFELLCPRIKVSWTQQIQVNFRRNWLLSMGLTEREKGGDRLTELGRGVLAARDVTVPILPPEPIEDQALVEEEDEGEAVLNEQPLTLTPAQVLPHLGDLLLPATLLERCCAALTAGRHLLLVGPPGTGKTELATVLAEAAKNEGFCEGLLTATASADWTTFDTIGGYALEQGGQLRFRPGVYPRALKERRWLLIDELNRADVDKAFGELMTVLSGKPVTTPYMEGDQAVSIGPDADGAYRQPQAFRLIATMNSWDRTSLFRLSAALQRRFAVIYVGPPDERDLETLLRGATARRGGLPAQVVETLVWLFGAQGLRPYRELGPAVALHMIDYIRHREDSPKGAFGLAEAIELQLLSQLEGVPLKHSTDVTQAIKAALAQVGCDPRAQAALERRLGELFPTDDLG